MPITACRPIHIRLAYPLHLLRLPLTTHRSSSGSSSRWTARQASDEYAKLAKGQGFLSRGAYKLIQIDDEYTILKNGQTVVDLGFAPGGWSQVAVQRTRPGGRVFGVDLIPTQPPAGVVALTGDFLDPSVQAELAALLPEGARSETAEAEPSSGPEAEAPPPPSPPPTPRVVDVVLSDMLMNTSGNPFRDHAMSMDLCQASLCFALDALKPGGHFVCKYYKGQEEMNFSKMLAVWFGRVVNVKPKASRSQSKENYFVALNRKSK